MLLSIIITTRNRKKNLFRCINSICKSNLPENNWELIVVDDYSNDGTEKINSSKFNIKSGKIIHHKSQQMMVKTRNSGAKIAQGKYLLFIDDDNVIHKNMVKSLLLFAEKNPRYGIFGPSMYFYDNKKKYMDYQTINLFTGKTTSHIEKTITPSVKNFFESDGIPNVFMINHLLLKNINYFDETLIQTYTEPDLTYRLKKIGYESICITTAITYHDVKHDKNYGPRTMGGGEFKQKAYFLMRNRSVIVFRYANNFQKTIYLLFFSWFWPVIYSIIMAHHKKFDLIRLYWLGYFDGIKYIITGKLYNSLL